MKIAIIGAGNMGSAIARGLARSKQVQPEDITVSNPSQGKLDALQADIPDLTTTPSNIKAAGDADIIILAVKPWVLDDVLMELPWRDGQMLASVVAGRSIHSIASILSVKYERTQMPNLTYFRIVPNTAAAIGQSMTLISSMAANPKQQQLMLDLLNPLGPTMLVPEDKLPAATALASCGTAYAMRYIQAATQAGIELAPDGDPMRDGRRRPPARQPRRPSRHRDRESLHTGRLHHPRHQRTGARRVRQRHHPGHQGKRVICNG